MKNKEIVFVEFCESFFKICRLSLSKGKKTIHELSAHECVNALEPLGVEKAFEHIGLSPCDELVISLSRSFFLIRFLELPSHDPVEIQRMVPFQLAKIVLSPLDDILYDFSIAETGKDSSRITVFIIQKKQIQHLLTALDTYGTAPRGITISSVGSGSWLEFEDRVSKAHDQMLTGLVDVDKNTADFIIINKGRLMFSRSFSFLRREQLNEGIYQSLMIFHKEMGKESFGRTVFTGIEVQELLREPVLGESVYIPWREHAPLEGAAAEIGNDYSFASLVGLTQTKTVALDFSPPALKAKRNAAHSKKRYVRVLAAALQAALIVSLLVTHHYIGQRAFLKYLNGQLQGMKGAASELDVVAERLKVIDEEFSKPSIFSKMLYTVTNALPSSAQLTLLDFKEDGDILVKGYVDEMSGVFAIVKALNESRVVRDVKIKYASQLKRKSVTKVEFFIQGVWND